MDPNSPSESVTRSQELNDMNEIFKYFKKRQNKATNINDILNEFNENENTASGSGQNNFDRASRSYISISKSGRLKSKKSHQQNRVLKDDLFQPQQMSQQQAQQQQQQSLSAAQKCATINAKSISILNKHKEIDQHSDNADSSRTSSVSGSGSYQSSFESLNETVQQKHYAPPPPPSSSSTSSQQQRANNGYLYNTITNNNANNSRSYRH